MFVTLSGAGPQIQHFEKIGFRLAWLDEANARIGRFSDGLH